MILISLRIIEKGFRKGFDIVVLYGSTTQFVAKKKEYEQRFLIPSAAGL